MSNVRHMRSPLYLIAVALIFAGHNAKADDLGDVPIIFKAVVGKERQICKEAMGKLNLLPRYKLWGDRWKESFGSTEWETDFYPSIDSEGKRRENEYEFRAVDINNDSQDEIVVKRVDMFSSALWDWLYVVKVNDFKSIRENRTIGELFGKLPQLNPRNMVVFSNGHESSPTEMQIWSFNKKNYIVMRNLHLGDEEHKDWASVFVAELRGSLDAPIDRLGNPRLVPHMICRFMQK